MLCCLQCQGSISADHLQCPHCHVPIIRRYCAGCDRLIPDHAELCPFCGSDRAKKRSVRRILRVAMSLAAAGLLLAGLVIYLPGNSAPKIISKERESSALPALSKTAVRNPDPFLIQPSEPQLISAAPPFAPGDLLPPTNTVDVIPAMSEKVPLNPIDLSQRGARLKAGRKLSELGSLYIRKRKFKEAAIVLRQAVEAFPPETRDVTYGESLYHLGYSLRMSGKPEEAIPVLKRALDFPLYSNKVEKELKTASAEMKKSR